MPAPPPPSATAQAAALDAYLSQVSDREAAFLAATIVRLRNQILTLSNRLSLDARGNIRGPKWTLRQATAIQAQLVKVYATHWTAPVQDLGANLPPLATRALASLDALGVETAWTAPDAALLRSLAQQRLAVFAQLGEQSRARIVQAVYDASITGQPLGQLQHEIAGALEGAADVRGTPLASYAHVYAQDSLMQTYQRVHIKKAADAGLTHFMYFGDVIRDSRPFCVERAGKVFSQEEIDSWTFAWKGKSGPAMTCRGGYNCRHHWHAVDPAWVG